MRIASRSRLALHAIRSDFGNNGENCGVQTSKERINKMERRPGMRRSNRQILMQQNRGWRGAMSNAPNGVPVQSTVARCENASKQRFNDRSDSRDDEPCPDRATPGARRKIEQKMGQRSQPSDAAIGAWKLRRKKREKQRTRRPSSSKGDRGEAEIRERRERRALRGAHD